MEFLNSIFSWIIKKRIHQIELFEKYPIEVQNDVFKKLVQTARNTEWGKTYEYNTIQSYQDYKKRVPIQDYEDVKKNVLRMKHGEQDVLWPGEVKWFAKSSGTTNDKSKFIPVSKESLENCHYKAGKDLLSIYCNNKENSRLFSGKSLVVGGSSQVNQFASDSYYGDLSAIIIRNLPFWVEYRRTPDLSIALMSEWEEKLEKLASSTAQEDVTNIAGVPSWTLVLLNRILEITGKKSIAEVWPHLELYMHGGVSFAPYKKQFQNIISSKTINYMETYNASEGFFGIQNDLNSADMLLMLDYGIFYEFIPCNNPDKIHSLEEVELNKNYELVISTNAGLWRYKIGDTIQFTSLYPFKIVVTGRVKQHINVFGEELMIDNTEKALKIACEKTDCLVSDYTVAPVFMEEGNKGRHEWLIEFSKPPQNLDYFSETLDNALKSLNSDYEAKRYKGLALENLLLTPLPVGTFYKWMKKRGKLGGQNKVPRLSNDRKYADDIKTLSEC